MRWVVAVLAACGGNPATPADAPPPDDPPPDAPLGAFGAPAPLTELNTADSEEDPSLPADQLEIFFVSNRLGGPGANDIWTAVRASTSEPFGMANPVGVINTVDGEFHPQVSPDGLSMYMVSNRPGGAGAADIYFTTRATRTAPWVTPTRVVELSSPNADFAAAPDSSGLQLVLGSNRSGSIDLFVSSRTSTTAPWRGPAAIAVLNTAAEEQDGVFAAQGRALYFTKGGDPALLKEIAVARRATVDDAFGPAELLPELGSAMDELDPWVADDERTIYFNSNRGGNEDLYFSTR
jgi:Tol biopolymer transport system component